VGRELLRGPPVPVQGGRQVLELDRLTPRRTTNQQRDKGGDDDAGYLIFLMQVAACVMFGYIIYVNWTRWFPE